MIRYLASVYRRIEKVEVISETDHFLTYKTMYGQRRQRKINETEGFFYTFEEAKKFVVDHAENCVKNAENRLKYALEDLSRARELKE